MPAPVLNNQLLKKDVILFAKLDIYSKKKLRHNLDTFNKFWYIQRFWQNSPDHHS